MGYVYRPDVKPMVNHSCSTPGRISMGYRLTNERRGTMWQCENPQCGRLWYSKSWSSNYNEWKRVRWYHYNMQMKMMELKQKTKEKKNVEAG